MVPSTVPNSGHNLQNIIEVVRTPVNPQGAFQVTDSNNCLVLWTKAYLSLAVCTRGGGQNCVALANLDTDAAGQNATLGQLGDTIKQRVGSPGNVWITLIRDANTTSMPNFRPDYYYWLFKRGYGQDLPDDHKNDIAGSQQHAAVHFDGYVGELTLTQKDMFNQWSQGKIQLPGIEQTMLGGYYNKAAYYRTITT